MLRDLTIQNYRVFKDFSIDGLARVNLIVGMNNSGKTSFLEAIYLLVNQGDPSPRLQELLENRGDRVANIIHGHHLQSTEMPSSGETIQLQSEKDRFVSLQMGPGRYSGVKFVISGLGEPTSGLVFVYRDGWGGETSGTLSPSSISEKRYGPHRFITTRHLDSSYLAKLWDGIMLTPEEDDVVQALQILEPDVERVSFTSRHTSYNGILLKLRGRPNPTQLSTMGDGMQRILALAMSTVTAKNGVLMVDEIDTGLYHGAQTDLWRLLIETAQRLDVQIFATTHSWDCVAAFQEALAQSPGESVGRLFRLESQGEDIRAVKYDADDLAIAVRQAIEVR